MASYTILKSLDLDTAKLVPELVYSVYGYTYYPHYLYDPAALLERQ